MGTKIFQTYAAHEVTDTMLEDAAKLFSDHYGTWGEKAASAMGPFAKAGKTSVNIMARACPSKSSSGNRVKLNAKRLRKEYLSGEAEYVYTRAIVDGVLAGNAFGCRYTAHDKNVCWVTQLVVHSKYRRRRLATSLLQELRKDTDNIWLMSSQPAS